MEHALDGVAVTIEERRETILPLAVGLGRDVRHRVKILDLPADRIGIVAFVAVQNFAIRKSQEQFGSGCAIGDLAAGKHEGERSAVSIGQRMDPGRATAA